MTRNLFLASPQRPSAILDERPSRYIQWGYRKKVSNGEFGLEEKVSKIFGGGA